MTIEEPRVYRIPQEHYILFLICGKSPEQAGRRVLPEHFYGKCLLPNCILLDKTNPSGRMRHPAALPDKQHIAELNIRPVNNLGKSSAFPLTRITSPFKDYFNHDQLLLARTSDMI